VLKDADQDEWVWSATFTPDDEQIVIGVNHRQLVEASKETIHVWPTKDWNDGQRAVRLCWQEYDQRRVDQLCCADLPYEKTCDNFPEITSDDVYEATLFFNFYCGLCYECFSQATNCTQVLRLVRSTYEQGRLHELPTLMTDVCMVSVKRVLQKQTNAKLIAT